jgi:UDPglucose 6-dehydrogenase
MKIGFIGQGFIGKHMADDFAERGYDVVRYALEEPYRHNREAIAACTIVFIAVPTPTTPRGFDATAIEQVLALVGEGKIAVIKSTVSPGATARLQQMFPTKIVLHSPEFLREKHAASDTRRPCRNIIGVPYHDTKCTEAATLVLSVLPPAPYNKICHASEAELVKYGGNCFLALKVVYMNLLFDMAASVGADYSVVAEAMGADERIGNSHMQVIDTSGHHGAHPGRGAGGHCFPKDLAALRIAYGQLLPSDGHGYAMLRAIEKKNVALLRGSQKDLDLLFDIYVDQ